MAYKTINVKPSTYEALLEYKWRGLSFDDVLRALMKRVDPFELNRSFMRSLRRDFAKMKKGDFLTHEQLLRELGLEPARTNRRPHTRPRSR